MTYEYSIIYMIIDGFIREQMLSAVGTMTTRTARILQPKSRLTTKTTKL